MKTLLPITAAALFVVVFSARCHAQVTVHEDPQDRAKPAMIGTLSRGGTLAGGSAGGTLSRSVDFGTTGAAAKIPSGRFLRENRRSGDFVGRDARERDGFVGLQEASGAGPVRSATRGLQIKQTPEANIRREAADQRRNAIYDPRLVVAFKVTRQPPQEVQAVLERRLLSSPNLRWAGPVEVTVRDDTAVLSGKAASSSDREMAALVLMLEPGIDAVDNRLTVQKGR